MKKSLGYNPIELARYILAKQGSISNMKLQKLLFYVESVFMATTNKSLFEEDFEAWRHGPVIPSVYHEFKKYSVLRSNIPFTRESTVEQLKLPAEYVELIDKIIEVFGEHDGDILSMHTHKDEPYKVARAGVPEGVASNAIMNKTQIKKYYRAKLVNAKNVQLKEISAKMKKDIAQRISERYKEAWVELAK